MLFLRAECREMVELIGMWFQICVNIVLLLFCKYQSIEVNKFLDIQF
jgi:hypothetical protein